MAHLQRPHARAARVPCGGDGVRSECYVTSARRQTSSALRRRLWHLTRVSGCAALAGQYHGSVRLECRVHALCGPRAHTPQAGPPPGAVGARALAVLPA